MDFYDRIGVVALGSRLRRLGDRLADEATSIHTLFGTDLQPRWFPVFYVLSERQQESVTAIAEEIGHSHASVSQIVADMVKKGYAVITKGKDDGRKSFVTLSDAGRKAGAAIETQLLDVEVAARELIAESTHDLWAALAGCEAALNTTSLYERVRRAKEIREGKGADTGIRIVDFAPAYKQAFKDLNEEWIETWFEIEEGDLRVLNNPEAHILAPGGHILVALDGDEPVGVCALVPHGRECFELAKMAVSPRSQGRGVGLALGRAAIEKARSSHATRLCLESNTLLKPAISLYRKLGFQEIAGEPPAFRRCNIQMELILDAGA